jgi:hypothetical protein
MIKILAKSTFDTDVSRSIKRQIREAFRLAFGNGVVTKYSLNISAMQHTAAVMLMSSRRRFGSLQFPVLYLHALQRPYHKTTVKL